MSNIRCPECKGEGKSHALIFGYRYPQTMQCPQCHGSGALTGLEYRWWEAARKLPDLQRARGLTTRKAATLAGMTATEYCDRRAGRKDPRPLLDLFGETT